jgi:hypothetical protein
VDAVLFDGEVEGGAEGGKSLNQDVVVEGDVVENEMTT